MNRKDLNKKMKDYIRQNMPEFIDSESSFREVSTEAEDYKKTLKMKAKKRRERVFSYTFRIKSGFFKKVLIITVTEHGEIVKTSLSR